MSEEFFMVIIFCFGEILKMCVRDGVVIEYVRLVRGWEFLFVVVIVVIIELEYVGKKIIVLNIGEEKIGGRLLILCIEIMIFVKVEKLGVLLLEILILNLYDDMDLKFSICEGRKEKFI